VPHRDVLIGLRQAPHPYHEDLGSHRECRDRDHED
jgi:hypothetical protein